MQRRLPTWNIHGRTTLPAIPMVLRSRLAVAEKARISPSQLPLVAAGTTYTMAQEASWVDEAYFAVGRWDGSLSVFKFTEAPSNGPMVAKAVNAPDQEGVQMITSVGGGMFISSNDEDSAVCWIATQPDWSDLRAASQLRYATVYGVANSGALAVVGEQRYFVMGHANGWVTIWQEAIQTIWTEVKAVDVRSAHPVNPWGLHNVRGIAVLAAPETDAGYVVTGSEDGNLTVIRLPDGAIMSTTVYSPAAQRGINSLAVSDGVLLVANCAVGPADFNLWAYTVASDDWTITPLGKAKLAIDPGAPQVFNFDVIWTDDGSGRFFCSTEEGALWMGQCSVAAGLSVSGYEMIGGAALGSAICVQKGELAAAAYDLHEFLVANP